MRSRPRGLMRPRFGWSFPYPPIGGRRECRAPDAPDSRVCNDSGRTHTRWSGHTGITRHSPRNGLRLTPRSPRRPAFLPPSSLRSLLPGNLMPASGHQDHTASPSALAPFVKSAAASTASRSTSVTIASAPPRGTGRGELVKMICPTRQAGYFSHRDWTTQVTLIRLDKSDFARKSPEPVTHAPSSVARSAYCS